MLWYMASGLSAKSASSRSGEQGIALPTVLVTIALLVLVASTVAARARSEVRAGTLERDVAQIQNLLVSAMDELSKRAKDPAFAADPAIYPDPTQPKPAGWSPCNPTAVNLPDPAGSSYCTDVLLRRLDRQVVFGTGGTLNCNLSGTCAVISVAVRWKIREADSQVRTTYGWLIVEFTDSSKSSVKNVRTYYQHHWCPDGGGSKLCK